MKKFLKKIVRRLRGDERRTDIRELTETQKLFCDWNAERLGISYETSEARYRQSWAAILGGHSGSAFRKYCDTTHRIFQVFFDDNENEVFETYRFHGYLHFLRMTSYTESGIVNNHSLIDHISTTENPRILDFGCGMAALSRHLAEKLKEQRRNPNVTLADIPTIRKDFLTWWGQKKDISVDFLDCTIDQPIPKLPACDLCIALEVFEHLHDPEKYFFEMDAVLENGGFLYTNVEEHEDEFMHVSPSLSKLRTAILEAGYEEIEQDRLFRKK